MVALETWQPLTNVSRTLAHRLFLMNCPARPGALLDAEQGFCLSPSSPRLHPEATPPDSSGRRKVLLQNLLWGQYSL